MTPWQATPGAGKSGVATLVGRRGEAHVDTIGMKAAGRQRPIRLLPQPRLVRREPAIEWRPARKLIPDAAPDPEVLRFAPDDGRVLVSPRRQHHRAPLRHAHWGRARHPESF